MGRPRTPLSAMQADQALAYLQRALDRKADFFSAGLKETGRTLAALRRQGLTLRQADFEEQANIWLDRNLTLPGRRTLLTALRQERAQARREEPLHTLRLSAAVHADLAKRAQQLGLSLPATVARLLGDAGQV